MTRLTDAEIKNLWERACKGWNEYADEQELDVKHLIFTLLWDRAEKERAEYFDSQNIHEAKDYFQRVNWTTGDWFRSVCQRVLGKEIDDG